MGSPVSPFNSPFGSGKPEQLPLSSMAGKPMIGPGKKGRSKKAAGGLVWEKGYDPSLWLSFNGATVSAPNGTTNVTAMDPARDWNPTLVNTELLYIEAVVTKTGAFGAGDYVSFGFRDKADLIASADQFAGIGMCWHQNANNLYVCKSAATAFSATTTYNTPLADGDVIGVAIDNVNNKLYFHVNGTWVTDGTNGGAPSGGLGWTFLNTSATCVPHAAFDLNGSTAAISLTSNSRTYLPSGYTAWS